MRLPALPPRRTPDAERTPRTFTVSQPAAKVPPPRPRRRRVHGVWLPFNDRQDRPR